MVLITTLVITISTREFGIISKLSGPKTGIPPYMGVWTVLEQGEHLARRQELVGFSRGGDRRSNYNGYSLKTTSEIAKEIGLSEPSVYKRMQAARNIVPEVKDAIRNTEIANSTTQLLELARLAPEKQVEVQRLHL